MDWRLAWRQAVMRLLRALLQFRPLRLGSSGFRLSTRRRTAVATATRLPRYARNDRPGWGHRDCHVARQAWDGGGGDCHPHPNPLPSRERGKGRVCTWMNRMSEMYRILGAGVAGLPGRCAFRDGVGGRSWRVTGLSGPAFARRFLQNPVTTASDNKTGPASRR